MTPPRVTVRVACSTCGGTLSPGRRSHSSYCSNACRQKAYRQRQAPRNVTLTADLRAYLRAEVDRLTRERLQAQASQCRKADARLHDVQEIAA